MLRFTCSLVVLAIAATAITAELLDITDCGSQQGEVLELDVSPCPETPCKLVKGKESTIDLKFRSDVDTSVVTAKLWGIIAGIPIPWSLPESDGCETGVSCPVKAGDVNTFSTGMTVPGIAPTGLRLTVRFRLEDENNRYLACAVFPAEIASA